MSTDPYRTRGAGTRAGRLFALLAVGAALVAALSIRAQDEPLQVPPPGEPDPPPAGPYDDPLAEEPPEGAVLDEEESGDLVGSYFAASLLSSAGWQEGFLLGDEDEGDAVFRLTPRLLLVHSPTVRTELTAAYAPELEVFDRHSELDAVHHAAGAAFRHDLTRRSRVLAGGSILDGEDPTRQLGGLNVLLPRVPYQQSRLYGGFEHRWQRTSVLFHLGHTRTEIDAAEDALFAGSDQSENVAGLTLLRSLTAQTDLSASYSFIDPSSDRPGGFVPDPGDDPDDPDPVPDPLGLDEPIQTLTLGLGHRFDPRLAVQLSGGVLERSDELSWVGAAELLRSGDPLSFRVRYDRSLLSFGSASAPGEGVPVQPATPNAAVGDTLTDSLALGFLARLTDRLRWRQVLEAARTDLASGDTLETLGGSGRLTVEATRRIGTFLELDYLDQQGSDLFGESGSRWSAALGLIVGVTGPEAAWGVREAPERLNAILPDRTGAFDG